MVLTICIHLLDPSDHRRLIMYTKNTPLPNNRISQPQTRGIFTLQVLRLEIHETHRTRVCYFIINILYTCK